MKARHVACPTCGREIEWNETERWRPFCSERCQLIDLGAWFEEQRSVPGESSDVAPDEPEPQSASKPQH